MEKLKVGVIGAGKMGLLHACIFNSLDNSMLTAICEKKLLVSNILKNFISSVNIYRDFREMVDKENLDVVVITTPVFLHKMMVECAMEHNLHIFVEKPLAMNTEECQILLSKRFECKSLVGYCRRFMETYTLAKKIIENTDLGKVHYFYSQLFVSQVFKQQKGWQYNQEMSGGGVLMDLGSHAIDLFHYLFGDIDTVHAFGKPVFNKDVEDYVSVNLKFKNEIFGLLQLSWSVRNYRLPELMIKFQLEDGIVTVTEKYIDIYSEKETTNYKKGSNIFYKQNLVKNIPINVGGSEYTSEDLHLLNCVIDNRRSLCDFREAAKVHSAIDKIYSSMDNNQIESVNYKV
ncbi:UDP-N-acetylglucosamine 3-dehydrogenase [uncultured archaeon]|nr:UDP-N-acetylglucosamine 3-dehydrogenase [uncultured archaeon]